MTPSGTSSARKIAAASNLSPKLGTTQKRRKGRRPYPPPYPPPQAGEGKGRDNSHQPMVCPSCQAENRPDRKFCGECGTALTTASRATAGQPAVPPAAERRLVSVLFADLVGFTSLSDSRDPEDVRDLLTRYFETSREVVGPYGGTVDK